MTVLIADNDRAVGGLLGEVLQQAGLEPIHAWDGHEASRLARRADLRVFVCDLDMPGRSGLEVLESLRDLPAPPPAVVVSGFVTGAVEERLRALPFVREVLRKPFDLLRFSATVQRLAGPERRAEDAAAGG